MSVRTEPRFTRDADVCVAVADDREAEAMTAWLRAVGYRILAIVEQEPTGRIATVRLAAENGADDGVVLDLLFASSGIEREVVDTAEETDVFEGVGIPVASVAALIALKVLARDDLARPQDGSIWSPCSASPPQRIWPPRRTCSGSSMDGGTAAARTWTPSWPG